MNAFNNITAQDILSAICNNGRRIKRKTCNSNGTRYTMNRIKYGRANSITNKNIDHRNKLNNSKKPRKYLLFEKGGWISVFITKKTYNRLKKKGKEVREIIQCIEPVFDPRGFR